MAGREHLLGIEREGQVALPQPLMRPGQILAGAAEDHDRLAEHGQRAVAAAIFIGLADQLRRRAGDRTGEKGGDVQLLPGRQVEAQRNGDLGLEAHRRALSL
jgi:hypothetical protein